MKQQTLMKNLILSGLLVVVSAMVGCSGIHSFDSAQVPVISVSSGTRPVISWMPEEAYRLDVYSGTEDGDGLGVLWTARSAEYANQLMSPVTYGVPAAGSDGKSAPPLQAGTYTVTVRRKDPKGSGDGFTNTHRRYVGKKTFRVE